MGWNNWFGKKETVPQDAGAPADLKVVVLSDLGNVRTNNEDTGLFFRVADGSTGAEKGSLLLVADGMGGHACGEVASRMAGDIVSREYFSKSDTGPVRKSLQRAFLLANRSILRSAAENPEQKGMGTTCTALAVIGRQVYFAHVGDSRAYALRKSGIVRITSDHTYVQELVRSGQLRPDEADTHPQRNILTNAMGTKPDLRVDTGQCDFSLEDQDRLLLCSDGLYDYLSDGEIADLLGGPTVQQAAERLVAEAKSRGGHDNITVVVAEVNAPAAEPDRQTREWEVPVTKEIDLP